MCRGIYPEYRACYRVPPSYANRAPKSLYRVAWPLQYNNTYFVFGMATLHLKLCRTVCNLYIYIYGISGVVYVYQWLLKSTPIVLYRLQYHYSLVVHLEKDEIWVQIVNYLKFKIGQKLKLRLFLLIYTIII